MADTRFEIKGAPESCRDAIRGCIFGGAVGDALGYPVEFLDEESIFRRFRYTDGIASLVRDPWIGKAVISDDTQMTLFTADGLLVNDTRAKLNGLREAPRHCVAQAYLNWLITQESDGARKAREMSRAEDDKSSWLLEVPQLFAGRAPGSTCLNSMRSVRMGDTYEDYVRARRNSSKGCGGIMRVAPVAVSYQNDIEDIDMEAAQVAAITHGHPLGYMPAAVLAHVLNRIVFPPEGKRAPLKDIILEAKNTAAKIFAGEPYLASLKEIIDLAVSLADDDTKGDLAGIHEIGEGWVGEETLGIALFCALRHQDDFSAGVIAAVNHNGDSDSTGAVTGNILGALVGYDAIEEKWKTDLELSDVILEIADDVCTGCRVTPEGRCEDPDWETKYVKKHRPRKE